MVSVVITVLNEASNIKDLLQSLKKQKLLPTEIIVVDGGSTDNTVAEVLSFKNENPNLAVNLLQEGGNISHGRNIGVINAKNQIIAMTDAGCVASKYWLSRLVKPFSHAEDILVAGFYEMKAQSPWQKAVAPFLGVTKRRLDPRTFLPSARSIAFSKSVWSSVGGFDETLERAGEDTLFNYKIIKKDIPIIRVPTAIVFWEVPRNLSETAKKFFWYAKGDASTGIWWHPGKKLATHNLKILSIYLRYVVLDGLLLIGIFSPFFFFLFLYALIGYLFWSIWKMKLDVTEFRARLLIPFVQLLSDVCVMVGFASGLLLQAKKNV